MSDHVDVKVAEMRTKLESKLKKWDRPIWGYKPEPEPARNEGDIWVDANEKTWTIKNGIKQTVTRMHDAKIPWWCPKCSNAMSHRFDTKFYNLYNQCYDCSIKQHTQMMVDGTWERFETKRLLENELACLKDMIQERKDYIRTFKIPQIHFENGGWEELATLEQFSELFDSIKDDISKCETRLAQIEEELNKDTL